MEGIRPAFCCYIELRDARAPVRAGPGGAKKLGLEMHPSWNLAQRVPRPGAGSRSTCTPRTRTRTCPR